MERAKTMNPFVKRENYAQGSVVAHRTLTTITWLLVVLLSLIYTIDDPSGARSIQGQNAAHPSPFSLDPILIAVYWIALLLSQLTYVYSLFTNNSETVVRAANAGIHFVLNNILLSIFILLWVHGHFWFAEVCLVLNYFNLIALYFRHSGLPLLVHFSAVAGPKAWNFVVLFTNGAAMFGARNLPARIVANVFIWALLLYGLFFLGAFQDYAMGVALVLLTAALAVQQFSIQAFSLQTIFAFVILAILAVATLLVCLSRLLGKELPFSRSNNDEGSGERRPLLDDE